MFDRANNFSNTCVVIEDLVQHILQNHATFVSITRNATAHLSFFIFFLFLFSFMKIVIRGYHSFHRFHSPLWFEQFFIRMLMQKSISIPTITNSVYINYSILNNLISRIINIFQITYHLSIPFSRILTNWKIVFANFWWNNDKKKISSSFYIIVHSYSLYNS